MVMIVVTVVLALTEGKASRLICTITKVLRSYHMRKQELADTEEALRQGSMAAGKLEEAEPN